MADRAYVTPAVLKWARITARITPEEASAKVAVKVERLLEWESGSSLPTIRQAETLAAFYRRPFALFFLNEIPRDFHPLQDFRKPGSIPLSTASLFIMRETQHRQAWISDEFRSNGEPKVTFVGSFTKSDDPVVIANNILQTLDIDPKRYNNSKPLRKWIEKAEANGIFISRTSFIHSRLKLNSDEFQGFAIADSYAPFVFLNSDDWDSPMLFTLAHELAHIWIAESGISNSIEPTLNVPTGVPSVERFCNEIAANALLPQEVMDSIPSATYESANQVFRVARSYGVSSFAFLVRSYRLGLISLSQYKNLKLQADDAFRLYLQKEKARSESQKADSSGPSYYLLQLQKNGRRFTQYVLDAYRGGAIEPSHASLLLNVKVNNFSGLEKQLYG